MIRPGYFYYELLATYLPSSFRSWLPCRRIGNAEADQGSQFNLTAVTNSKANGLENSFINHRIPRLIQNQGSNARELKINLDAGSFDYILPAYFVGIIPRLEVRSLELESTDLESTTSRRF